MIQKRIPNEIEKCVTKLQNNEAAGVDGIVTELMIFGGEGVVEFMVLLHNYVWKIEYTQSR